VFHWQDKKKDIIAATAPKPATASAFLYRSMLKAPAPVNLAITFIISGSAKIKQNKKDYGPGF
jgi:hypothetical protein